MPLSGNFVWYARTHVMERISKCRFRGTQFWGMLFAWFFAQKSGNEKLQLRCRHGLVAGAHSGGLWSARKHV